MGWSGGARRNSLVIPSQRITSSRGVRSAEVPTARHAC